MIVFKKRRQIIENNVVNYINIYIYLSNKLIYNYNKD